MLFMEPRLRFWVGKKEQQNAQSQNRVEIGFHVMEKLKGFFMSRARDDDE